MPLIVGLHYILAFVLELALLFGAGLFGFIRGGRSHRRGLAAPALECFQEKWTPLFRFENTTTQRHRADQTIPLKRDLL